jgi:hypothetical protein
MDSYQRKPLLTKKAAEPAGAATFFLFTTGIRTSFLPPIREFR